MKCYLVIDYDIVVYCGTNLANAKKHVKGNNCVQCWKGDTWLYDVQKINDKWTKIRCGVVVEYLA